jgi:hypothetical protein
MVIVRKCDRCGFTGPDSEFPQSYGEDFCAKCFKDVLLENLRRKRADKQQWLDDTHLKELKNLDDQIAELEK